MSQASRAGSAYAEGAGEARMREEADESVLLNRLRPFRDGVVGLSRLKDRAPMASRGSAISS